MSTSRILASALRSARPSPILTRSLRTSAVRAQEATTSTMSMPAVRRPVGAFRGGVLGFLLGTSVAAYGTYAYVLEEYRMSNEALTEDIYAMQAAVTRIHDYVRDLESKMEKMEKRR